MSKDNVINLSDELSDGKLWSPEQALRDAIRDIGERGAFKSGKKILILALDDNDENYQVSFTQAGMNSSDCVCLCEYAKSIFISQMRS